jgi:hypothetical protein
MGVVAAMDETRAVICVAGEAVGLSGLAAMHVPLECLNVESAKEELKCEEFYEAPACSYLALVAADPGRTVPLRRAIPWAVAKAPGRILLYAKATAKTAMWVTRASFGPPLCPSGAGSVEKESLLFETSESVEAGVVAVLQDTRTNLREFGSTCAAVREFEESSNGEMLVGADLLARYRTCDGEKHLNLKRPLYPSPPFLRMLGDRHPDTMAALCRSALEGREDWAETQEEKFFGVISDH